MNAPLTRQTRDGATVLTVPHVNASPERTLSRAVMLLLVIVLAGMGWLAWHDTGLEGRPSGDEAFGKAAKGFEVE